MRRIWVLVAFAIAACAAPATAAPVPLATVPADVPISAGSGWVVWSTPATGGGWGLAAWHAGQVIPLPVGHRAQPFDVDVGTDANGRAVATFSRCTTAPTLLFGLVQPWTGAGCRVRVVDLATGRERAGGVPRPKRTSDTTPSMWRGRIAFARRDPRHHDVSQLFLWSPSSRRLTALRHGAMPTGCPYQTSCKSMTARGAVQRLDLGSKVATFVWQVVAPGVVGHAGWEVRADRLDSGRSVLTGSGFVGEACTGSVDGVGVSTPSADGDAVWHVRVEARCEVDTPALVRFDTRTGRAAFGSLSGEIMRFTRDAGTLYALVAPPTTGYPGPQCDQPGAPCTIERLDQPTMVPKAYTPRSPFY